MPATSSRAKDKYEKTLAKRAEFQNEYLRTGDAKVKLQVTGGGLHASSHCAPLGALILGVGSACRSPWSRRRRQIKHSRKRRGIAPPPPTAPVKSAPDKPKAPVTTAVRRRLLRRPQPARLDRRSRLEQSAPVGQASELPRTHHPFLAARPTASSRALGANGASSATGRSRSTAGAAGGGARGAPALLPGQGTIRLHAGRPGASSSVSTPSSASRTDRVHQLRAAGDIGNRQSSGASTSSALARLHRLPWLTIVSKNVHNFIGRSSSSRSS